MLVFLAADLWRILFVYERVFNNLIGSEELVEFGGYVGRVHNFEGEQSVGGARTVPFGTGEAAGGEFAWRHAGSFECL